MGQLTLETFAEPEEPSEVRPHPHDRECYEVFATAMGWAASWWNLGTAADIPGPGQRPFVLAFAHCRELVRGEKIAPAGCVDHWGDYLKRRADRVKVEKPKRTRRRKA